MGGILIARIFRELVNDSQFAKFSPTILVNTVKLLKICHHPRTYIGGLANYGAYKNSDLCMCVHKFFALTLCK